MTEYLATGPDPAVLEFLRYDFSDLEARFGGAVGTTFRTFPSFPQRYIELLPAQAQPELPATVVIQPLRVPSGPQHFTERDLISRQFLDQGYVQIACPPADQLLPLRYPNLIRQRDLCLFEKADMQVLLLPTYFTPRTRLPHKPRIYILLSSPLGGDGTLDSISAAIREPRDQYSIVDQLLLDSYPTLSPLPDFTVFAADEASARRILDVMDLRQRKSEPSSMVIHKSRLMVQIGLA